jgi:repressor LexA
MDENRRNLRSEVLSFVKRYVEKNGYAPTCEEIREAIGLSSKSHATYYLGALEREGLIERTPYAPRGLRLVKVPAAGREAVV